MALRAFDVQLRLGVGSEQLESILAVFAVVFVDGHGLSPLLDAGRRQTRRRLSRSLSHPPSSGERERSLEGLGKALAAGDLAEEFALLALSRDSPGWITERKYRQHGE